MSDTTWRKDPAVADALEALWEELPGYVADAADAALDRLCDAVARATLRSIGVMFPDDQAAEIMRNPSPPPEPTP